MIRFALTSTLVIAITTVGVHAQVIETDSERFTRAAPDAGGQSIDTQNFGPAIYGAFDDFNSESIVAGASSAGGVAEQHSSVTAELYTGSLSASASADPDFFDIVNGFGHSYYRVSFTVSSTVNFNVAGFAEALGSINGETSDAVVEIISLSGGTPSQSIIDLSDGNSVFDVDGTLLPGDYELRAEARSVVSRAFDDTQGAALANVSFTMTFDSQPPLSPGDMNCSGAVDLDDVGPFIQAILDPSGYDVAFPNCDKNLADMNEDTLRNGADIADFVAALVSA